LEDLLQGEDEQPRADADQAVANGAKGKLRADADEEQDAREDDRHADVPVAGLDSFLTIGVGGIGLAVELLRGSLPGPWYCGIACGPGGAAVFVKGLVANQASKARRNAGRKTPLGQGAPFLLPVR
jgi:hypothetical protein